MSPRHVRYPTAPQPVTAQAITSTWSPEYKYSSSLNECQALAAEKAWKHPRSLRTGVIEWEPLPPPSSGPEKEPLPLTGAIFIFSSAIWNLLVQYYFCTHYKYYIVLLFRVLHPFQPTEFTEASMIESFPQSPGGHANTEDVFPYGGTFHTQVQPTLVNRFREV